MPKSQYKPIYDVYPETRTPKPRGQNTINDIFTKRVPLLTATKEILDKYKDLPGDAILPLISQQKYNIAIKKILKHAGINRVVTRLNPTTGEPEHCVISDILSSHSARKAFSGNIYDKIQDPNLICPLTGHKEGSKAFNRYRKIDEDTNRKTVSLLE